MARNDILVVPASDGWAVETVGGGRRTQSGTQDEAVKAGGTERAKADKVELLIHGHDGQIRERNSFGHDPRDIKG